MPSLKLSNLFRRDPVAPTLRERAAELRSGLSRSPKPSADAPAATHGGQVAQAGTAGDVLAVSGIDHRDGTVSYADATGKVARRPMARWVNFTAMQMHAHVQAEMGRRRVLEANDLPAEEHAAWEARIRRELRSDAVHALTFRSDRAFEAAQALRTGAEPATQRLREQSDAELLALTPAFDAAVDLYQQRIDEESAVCDAAGDDGWPGPAPEGSGAEWQAWFQRKEDWRERTGVEAAEEASAEAGRALYAVELQIAGLSAASLAGLRLKARVAQRSDDIGVDWPDGLGEGLVRDLLAFTSTQAALPQITTGLVGMVDVASASLEELQALHNTADLVGGVAYAASWRSRCRARGADDELNAAGMLMQWLGDALTGVETAANNEARRRVPTNNDERETRLEMLALPVIQNGDQDKTEAFARELLAHVEAERAGR